MRVLIIVGVLLIGCGGEQKATTTATAEPAPKPAAPPPPSVDEARTLIADSAEFSEYQFTNASYSLPMTQAGMNEPASEVAAQLRSGKWIAMDGSGNVVLTEKARGDRRFLVRPNGVVDIVPLAKKEILTVDKIEAGAEGPLVDFRWKWVPNEIGSAFKRGPLFERYSGEKKARATLLWDGSAWTVLRIGEAS